VVLKFHTAGCADWWTHAALYR